VFQMQYRLESGGYVLLYVSVHVRVHLQLLYDEGHRL